MDVIAVLLKIEVPLQMALRKMVDGLPPGEMRFLWAQVASHIESNKGDLAPALAQFPNVFPDSAVGIIGAGAKGGDLEAGIRRGRDYLESIDDLKKSAMAAITYPCIVLSIGLVVFLVMMIFTIPAFQKMITDLLTPGAHIPLLSKIIFGMSDVVRNQPILLFGVVATIITTAVMIVRTPKLKKTWFKMWMAIPPARNVLVNLAMARFCICFGSTYASVPNALVALEAGRNVVGNPLIEEDVDKTITHVKNGAKIGEAMRRTGKFPAALVIAVENGEAELTWVLMQMGEFYTKEGKRGVASALRLLEPILIVCVLGFAGTCVMAVFLPLIAIFKALT
jgi:type II secretory pathway component PulF